MELLTAALGNWHILLSIGSTPCPESHSDWFDLNCINLCGQVGGWADLTHRPTPGAGDRVSPTLRMCTKSGQKAFLQGKIKVLPPVEGRQARTKDVCYRWVYQKREKMRLFELRLLFACIINISFSVSLANTYSSVTHMGISYVKASLKLLQWNWELPCTDLLS